MNSYLTVGELLAALKDIAPDTLVVLQKDAEGNGYSPCAGVQADNAVYEADTTWSGEVKYAQLTDELRQQGYSEEDTGGSGAVPCVCLWPVN